MSISLSPSTAKGLLNQINSGVPVKDVEEHLADLICKSAPIKRVVAKHQAHSLMEALLVNCYNNKHNN